MNKILIDKLIADHVQPTKHMDEIVLAVWKEDDFHYTIQTLESNRLMHIIHIVSKRAVPFTTIPTLSVDIDRTISNIPIAIIVEDVCQSISQYLKKRAGLIPIAPVDYSNTCTNIVWASMGIRKYE